MQVADAQYSTVSGINSWRDDSSEFTKKNSTRKQQTKIHLFCKQNTTSKANRQILRKAYALVKIS